MDNISADSSMGDIIGEMYAGEIIQVYFGETGGRSHYSDFDIDQKIYLEGKVLWAKGMVLALECEVKTPSSSYIKEVLINCWNIYSVMKKTNDIQITYLFQWKNK